MAKQYTAIEDTRKISKSIDNASPSEAAAITAAITTYLNASSTEDNVNPGMTIWLFASQARRVRAKNIQQIQSKTIADPWTTVGRLEQL